MNLKLILCIVIMNLSLGAIPKAEAQAVEAKMPATQTVQWKDYTQGMKQATQEKKFVFIQFYAAWCPYCRKMDAVTLQDPKVQKSLARWFVPIRVEDKSTRAVIYEGKQIKEEDLFPLYRASSFPSLVFLEPDGTRLTLIPGYLGPVEFNQMLEFVGTGSYKKMTYEAYIKQSK